MANCPHCAEAFGWAVLLGRTTTCNHCRLPLRTDASGRLETYASRHAAEILGTARKSGHWMLLAMGTIATLFISLVPAFGLLTLFVLPIVQAICLERSVQRYREHFGLLHGLTVDFFSSFFFLALVTAQSLANFVVGPGAAVVAVPLYLGAWWGYGKYCESHFRRVAAGRPPGALELAVIGLIVGLLVLVPALLLLVVLACYFLGE
jgi:hypothetical protein